MASSAFRSFACIPLIALAAGCSSQGTGSRGGGPELHKLLNPPSIGRMKGGQEIHLGGFSGLYLLETLPGGGHRFATVTDRGPNADILNIAGLGYGLRPFLIPDFQPSIVVFRSGGPGSELQVESQLGLTGFDGKPLTGRPNLVEGKNHPDEPPVDPSGQRIDADPLGVDTEGLTRDASGNWWLCEEYRPALLKFSPEGRLLKRFVPKGTYTTGQLADFQRLWGAGRVVEALPEILRQRRLNNGFEGLTMVKGKLIAALQSPLPIPGKEDNRVRWIQFDPELEVVEAELAYPLTSVDVPKIGDIAAGEQGVFVIEQNSEIDELAVHDVYLVEGLPVEPGKELVPLKKRKVLDLVRAGYRGYAKVEGLAPLDGRQIAVVNDNDFAIKGYLDTVEQTIQLDPKLETVLGVFPLEL